MSDEKEVKTKFKGPGQWRSQAKRLETRADQAWREQYGDEEVKEDTEK